MSVALDPHEPTMPRKSLPDAIERNDLSLNEATAAERDVIEQLPDLWDEHDSITAMADQTNWSSSHVGAVYRKYFRAADESDDERPTTTPTPDADAEPRQPPRGSDVGVAPAEDSPTVTLRVDQIPDDEREALAFIRGVKSATAQ